MGFGHRRCVFMAAGHGIVRCSGSGSCILRAGASFRGAWQLPKVLHSCSRSAACRRCAPVPRLPRLPQGPRNATCFRKLARFYERVRAPFFPRVGIVAGLCALAGELAWAAVQAAGRGRPRGRRALRAHTRGRTRTCMPSCVPSRRRAGPWPCPLCSTLPNPTCPAPPDAATPQDIALMFPDFYKSETQRYTAVERALEGTDTQ